MSPTDLAARAAAIETLHDPHASDSATADACKTLRRLGPSASLAVEELIAALNRPPAVRDAAGDALRAIGPRAVPALVGVVNRKDNAQRKYAAELLGQMGRDAQSAVEPLRSMLDLNDKDGCVLVCRTLQALGRLATPAAEDVLKLLACDDAEVRRAAQDAMTAIARDQPAPKLARLEAVARAMEVIRYHQADEPAVRKACRQLADAGPDAQAAMPMVVELAVRSTTVRNDATAAVKAIGTDAAIPRLLEIIRSDQWDDRAGAAADVLARLGNGAMPAIEPLRQMLHAGNPLAYRACLVLGQLGPLASPAFPDLLEKLRSSTSPAARQAAAKAIGRMEPDTNPILLDALDSDKQPYEVTISRALEQVRAQGPEARGAIPIVAALLLDNSALIRYHARAVLDHIIPKTPYELEVLHHAYVAAEQFSADREISVSVRQAILRGCIHGDPGGREIQADIARGLADEEMGEGVRSMIVEAGPAAAPLVGALLPLLRKDGPVQLRALQSLTAIAPGVRGQQAVLGAVLPLLRSSDQQVRLNAALLLGALGKPDLTAVADLTRLVDSNDAAEAAAAAQALGQFGKPAATALPTLTKQIKRLMSEPAHGEADDAERAACAEAIARLAPDSPDVSELLLQAVKRKDWVVREHLAPALAKAPKDNSELVPDLLALAERAPDELVRVNARCALREIGVALPDSQK